MQKRAYVLLGNGIPEGETAYVVTRESAFSTRLWNAQTGQVYKSDDPACPLTSIGCIFDDKNIWANVQPFERPAELGWDLEDPKQWRPFFGPRGELNLAAQQANQRKMTPPHHKDHATNPIVFVHRF